MKDNENNMNENQCECGCCSDGKNKKEKKMTLHDLFLGILYAVIVYIGVSLCINRGLNANVWHLVAVTISVIGVFGIKLHKFRDELKAHIMDLSFVGILSILAIFATVSNLFF